MDDVPCNPLPFRSIEQDAASALGGQVTVQDLRYGKVYMAWDPAIRADDYLGGAAKRGSAAVCLPGRILVHLLCSQRAILTVDMNDFGYHLQAVREYSGFANGVLSDGVHVQDIVTVSGAGKNDGWMGCASWTAWQNVLVHRPAMEKYITRMLTERIPWPPRPGNMHLLAFEPALRYEKRALIHPRWRLCAPLKERACFPGVGEFDCYSCCDIRHGPRGKESCWSGPYTFEACCQQDFRDEHKRTYCVNTGQC